jgi:four helix bundle protein
MQDKKGFHAEFRELLDSFVNTIYDATQGFPKEEIFGVTSQLRRASLSVALNYIEGYARRRGAVFKNFLEIAYGSLKESDYLVHFSYNRGYIKEKDYRKILPIMDRVGKILWGIISKV